jgi:hypothetical protein
MRFTRKRIEGLPDIAKPSVQLPAADTDFRPDSLQYRSRDLNFVPGLPLPSAEAAPLPRPMWDRLYTNHLKLGLGNWLTPLVQLYVADGLNGRNPRTAWAVEYNHLSTAIGHTEQARFGNNHGAVRGKYYLDRHTLYGSLGFRHNVLRYYGDTSALVLPEWPDTLRQRFARFEGTAGIARNYDRDAFNYDVKLNVRTFADRLENRELHTRLLPTLGYRITDQYGIAATAEVVYSSITPALTGEAGSQYLVDLAPAGTVVWNRLSAHVGFRVALFGNADTSFTRLFPNIRANYQITYDSTLFAFLNLGGQTHYNTRFTLVDENPWLDATALVLPTVERFRAEAGVQGHLGRLNYTVAGFYSNSAWMPVFYSPSGPTPTDTAGRPLANLPAGEQGRFQILYSDQLSAVGIRLEASYLWKEKLHAGGTLQFVSYNLQDWLLPTNLEQTYFGMPNFTLKAWAGYKFGEKITARTALNLVGPRTLGTQWEGTNLQAAEQPFFADLNLYGEYALSNRISFFAEVNNALGMKYFRWYGYRERGFDFRVGGTFSL